MKSGFIEFLKKPTVIFIIGVVSLMLFELTFALVALGILLRWFMDSNVLAWGLFILAASFAIVNLYLAFPGMAPVDNELLKMPPKQQKKV